MSPILSFNPFVLLNADMSTNQESTVIDISEIGGYAVHSVFSGTPNGTLIVSGSNDISMGFVPVDAYSVTSAGSRLLNVERANYTYLKVSYTRSSGLGTLTVHVSGKII